MNEPGAQERPRIVVGVDGSEESQNALRWAASQAGYTGATLEAVIGWQYPAFYGWAPAVPDDADYGQIAEQVMTETLDKVFGPDRPTRLVIRVAARHPVEASEGASCWSWVTADMADSPMPCSARSAPTACITRTARSRSSGRPGAGTASADARRAANLPILQTGQGGRGRSVAIPRRGRWACRRARVVVGGRISPVVDLSSMGLYRPWHEGHDRQGVPGTCP
jgi:hypothetical protein